MAPSGGWARIREFTRDGLRDQFGMVLQDAWLYNDTIMENIRYGLLDATDEEVYQAARTANVDHFIRTLPEGYNMVLNEETVEHLAGAEATADDCARCVVAPQHSHP